MLTMKQLFLWLLLLNTGKYSSEYILHLIRPQFEVLEFDFVFDRELALSARGPTSGSSWGSCDLSCLVINSLRNNDLHDAISICSLSIASATQ